MKHLISILTIIIVFSLGINAQVNATSFEAYLTDRFHNIIGQQAERYNQDSTILHAVITTYMYDDSSGKLDTFKVETEKGATFRGTGWQVINSVSRYMSLVSKTKRNCADNYDCWKSIYFNSIQSIPEHPGISQDEILQDMGGYFEPVKRVEDDPGSTINITCDENSKSSLCQWMKDQKDKAANSINQVKEKVQSIGALEQKKPTLEQSKAFVERLNQESADYRSNLRELEYEYDKLRIEIGEIISSELQFIEDKSPLHLPNALDKQLARLYNQAYLIEEARKKYSFVGAD